MGRGIVLIDGRPILGSHEGDLEERSRSSDSHDWPVFSYSQGNTWNSCEQFWHYVYRLGYYSDQASGRGQSIGTLVHDAADVYYGNGRSEDAVDAWLKAEMEEVTAEQLPNLSKAFTTFKRYIKWSKDKDPGHSYVGNEIHIVVAFQTPAGRNFKIQAYIDLLTMRDGKVVVWDHKTTSTGFWSIWEFKMDPQLPLYGALLREHGHNVEYRILNMMNTYDYADGGKKKEQEDALFLRHELMLSDKEMNGTVREFKKLADALISRGDKPRKHMTKSCGKCTFREICSTNLTGLPVGPLLKANFNKKQPTQEIEK